MGIHFLSDPINPDARYDWSTEINTTGHVFRALVDNEDININITSNDNPSPPPSGKINTNLNLTLRGTTVGDASVIAILTNDNGNDVASETITFNVVDNKGFNKDYTAITDVNGRAVLDLNDLPAGLYTITATFAGDGNYATSNSQHVNINIKSSSTPSGFISDGNNGLKDTGFPGFISDDNNGLRDTGFPLIILLVLSVTGLLYWRKK
jgi:hypothetical protein